MYQCQVPKVMYQHSHSFQVKGVLLSKEASYLQIPITEYLVYKYKGFNLALEVSDKAGSDFSG